MLPAVFVDRDGVLNRVALVEGKPLPPRVVSDLSILPGTQMACRTLAAAGFLLVMVTNQPDIARGKTTRQTVDEINIKLARSLGLHAVKVCPHDDLDQCDCRKPKPGMLLRAASEWSVDLSASVMVGDRWRDIEAGRRAGCSTIWIRSKYDEPTGANADLVAVSLAAAVPWILKLRTAKKEVM
jgi:D-glycero-D-manno-heptose 1,7-bisphosphate phosphatase